MIFKFKAYDPDKDKIIPVNEVGNIQHKIIIDKAGYLGAGYGDSKGEWHELILLLSSDYKDKNSKEIFEYDVVELEGKKYYIEHTGSWSLKCINNLDDEFMDDFSYYHNDELEQLRHKCEIIGHVTEYKGGKEICQ